MRAIRATIGSTTLFAVIAKCASLHDQMVGVVTCSIEQYPPTSSPELLEALQPSVPENTKPHMSRLMRAIALINFENECMVLIGEVLHILS